VLEPRLGILETPLAGGHAVHDAASDAAGGRRHATAAAAASTAPGSRSIGVTRSCPMPRAP
jgi:hypothetical protein